MVKLHFVFIHTLCQINSVISQVTPNERFPTFFLATAHQLMLGHVTAPPLLRAHWCMPIVLYIAMFICVHAVSIMQQTCGTLLPIFKFVASMPGTRWSLVGLPVPPDFLHCILGSNTAPIGNSDSNKVTSDLVD